MATFNWLDIILAVIVIISAVAGLRTGFARVTIGLGATVIALIAGFWSYRMVAAEIESRINIGARAASIIGFLLVFAAVMLAGAVLAAIMAHLFRWMGLSWFDHLLGGIAGFLRGVLVIAAVADILVAYAPSPVPAFLGNSLVLPYATGVAGTLADLAPRELRDSFDQRMDALRHFWTTPAVPHSGHEI